MGLLVGLLQVFMPEYVRKRALAQLFSFTAEAFQVNAPSLAGLDSDACLAEYARFTQNLAEQRLREGRVIEAVEQRLYRNAIEMGAVYGRRLRVSTVRDVMSAGRLLYRILAIDFRGDATGAIVIQRCFFSRFYSPEVCKLMSALDRGLLAGLSNGGELAFASRITEGRPCCRAHFTPQTSRRAIQLPERTR